MKKSYSLLIWTVFMILSLFVIFFVKTEKDPVTKKDHITLGLDGYKSFKKGVDVAGGVVLTYKIDFTDYENSYKNDQELLKAKRFVKGVLEKQIDLRVNSLGVSDYNATFKNIDGQEYLVVEIGGVSDIENAKQIIGKTVKLDFMLPNDKEPTQDEIAQRKSKAEDILVKASSGDNLVDLFNYDDNIIYFNDQYDENTLPKYIKDNLSVLTAVNSGSVYGKLVDGTLDGVKGWGVVKFNGTVLGPISAVSGSVSSGTQMTGTNYLFEHIFIADKPQWLIAKDSKTDKILNGAYFLQALVESSQSGQPGVRIDFNSDGKEIWCDITKSNVGKKLAIFVGGRNISDPTIQEPICGGSTQITFGSASHEDAKKQANTLVEQLNYTLPVPLTLSQEEKISPMLGDNALRAAFIAGGVAFIFIGIFMVYMYGFRMGIIAIFALAYFMCYLFGLVKIMGYVLSLSGIAAIILNIGIGVDANVLIFERIREEFKEGKTVRQSIEDGFERSWHAIKDGNLTTIFIGILLFLIGTNVFKGFGAMMILTILLTLMVIVPVTKEFLYFFYRKELDKPMK